MPNQHSRNSRWAQAQSGQAIVLIALVIVALIAILGLAVDGGGLYFLQRDAQNATDAAVIAAAYARCAANKLTSDPAAIAAMVQSAGEDAATRNGFTNGQGGRTVTIQNPAPDSSHPTDNRYVQVDITATKPSYFIQLVYKDPLKVSVRAIGYCQPPFDKSTVKAVMGMAHDDVCTNNVVKRTGSYADIQGGVTSNGDYSGGGGNDDNLSGGVSAATDVVLGPHTTYPDGYTDYRTDPKYIDDPLANVYPIDQFKPGGDYAVSAVSADGTINYYHDVYDGGTNPDTGKKYKFTGSGTWQPSGTLQGVYYVEGNVDLGVGPKFGPLGVTFVTAGTIDGKQLGDDTQAYSGPGASGLLFYSTYDAASPTCTGTAINATGSYAHWKGLIYAPNGQVNVSAANSVIYGYIVGYTVNLQGDYLQLIADPDLLPSIPPEVKVSS